MRIFLLTCLLLLATAAWAEPRQWTGIVTCQDQGWQLLRSPQEFQEFVDRVPKQRVQKRQPAPPSQDPILKQPTVDFDHYSLVAVWSNNWAIQPRIENQQIDGDDLSLEIIYHTPKDYLNYQAPYNHGRYLVVQVPKVVGQLKVKSRAEIQ